MSFLFGHSAIPRSHFYPILTFDMNMIWSAWPVCARFYALRCHLMIVRVYSDRLVNLKDFSVFILHLYPSSHIIPHIHTNALLTSLIHTLIFHSHTHTTNTHDDFQDQHYIEQDTFVVVVAGAALDVCGVNSWSSCHSVRLSHSLFCSTGGVSECFSWRQHSLMEPASEETSRAALP